MKNSINENLININFGRKLIAICVSTVLGNDLVHVKLLSAALVWTFRDDDFLLSVFFSHFLIAHPSNAHCSAPLANTDMNPFNVLRCSLGAAVGGEA